MASRFSTTSLAKGAATPHTRVETLRDDHQSDRKRLRGNAATEAALCHRLASGDLLPPTTRPAHLPLLNRNGLLSPPSKESIIEMSIRFIPDEEPGCVVEIRNK